MQAGTPEACGSLADQQQQRVNKHAHRMTATFQYIMCQIENVSYDYTTPSKQHNNSALFPASQFCHVSE